MSILLLIKSTEQFPSAVRAVSQFLRFKQERFPDDDHERDGVVGIWIHRDLDTSLPYRADLGCCQEFLTNCGNVHLLQRPTAATLVIGSSFSHSGSWTLCWMVGFPPGAAHRNERREAIIRTFLDPPCSEVGSFFAVFRAEDSPQDVEIELARLYDLFPKQVNKTAFLDLWVGGIVAELSYGSNNGSSAQELRSP